MGSNRDIGTSTSSPGLGAMNNNVRHRNPGLSGSPILPTLSVCAGASISSDDNDSKVAANSDDNDRNLRSPKVHGRSRHRDECMRCNRRTILFYIFIATALCMVGFQMSGSLLAQTHDNSIGSLKGRPRRNWKWREQQREKASKKTLFEAEAKSEKMKELGVLSNETPEMNKVSSVNLISTGEYSHNEKATIRLDSVEGERSSASIVPSLHEVYLSRWGFVSRPRVVSCEFEPFLNTLTKPEGETEEKESSAITYGRDHFGLLLFPTKVKRLLTYESEPLSSPDRYVTPYPDDDNYFDRIQDIAKESKKYRRREREPLEVGTCKAKHDWQKGSYPICNTLHELELGSLSIMAGRVMRNALNLREGDGNEEAMYWSHGFWRDVWLVFARAASAKEEVMVLKTLRYGHEFDDRNYDRHRRDALASMRLSGSPNVVNIYAYCSNSAIFEYGDGGDVDEKIFPYDSKAKKHYTAKLSSWERLDIAFQVARGIADIHNVEEDGRPSIAHTDITPSQFIYMDGRYKVNDFNRCRFMRVDSTSGLPCGFLVGANPGKFRSPEEYAFEDENEKVDIYSMGNIFFTLISGEWPFEEVKEKEAQKRVVKGERPTIPKDLLHSDDVAIKALISATMKCWKQKPDDRPTAAEVRDELKMAMERIQMKLSLNNTE